MDCTHWIDVKTAEFCVVHFSWAFRACCTLKSCCLISVVWEEFPAVIWCWMCYSHVWDQGGKVREASKRSACCRHQPWVMTNCPLQFQWQTIFHQMWVLNRRLAVSWLIWFWKSLTFLLQSGELRRRVAWRMFWFWQWNQRSVFRFLTGSTRWVLLMWVHFMHPLRRMCVSRLWDRCDCASSSWHWGKGEMGQCACVSLWRVVRFCLDKSSC